MPYRRRRTNKRKTHRTRHRHTRRTSRGGIFGSQTRVIDLQPSNLFTFKRRPKNPQTKTISRMIGQMWNPLPPPPPKNNTPSTGLVYTNYRPPS